MATTFAAAVDALSFVGLNEALIRRPDNDRPILDTAFTMQVLRALLGATVIAGSAPLAASWFNEPRLTSILYVLACGAVVDGMENIGIIEFRRNLMPQQQIRILFIPRFLQVVICILLAYSLHSYWALPVSLVIGKLVRICMTYVMHSYRPRLTLVCWRELALFSFWTWVGSMVRMVWRRVDAFVLGPALGVRSFGVYLLGAEVALLPITELIEPALEMVFPGLSAARKTGTREAELLPEIMTVLLLPVIPLAIGLSASANCLTALLLGPQWADAVPVIAILSAGSMVSPLSYVCFIAIMAKGDIRRDVHVMALATVLRCCLIYGAGQAHSTKLAALAALASLGFEAILFIEQVRRTDRPDFRSAVGSFARMAVAATAVIAVLLCTGLGWGQALPSFSTAVVQAAAIAVITVLTYATVMLGLWCLAGNPRSAEFHAMQLAESLLRSHTSSVTRILADGVAWMLRLRWPIWP